MGFAIEKQRRRSHLEHQGGVKYWKRGVEKFKKMSASGDF